MMRKGVLACLLAFLAHDAKALVSKGTITVPARQVVFLTKFCFDYDPSRGNSGQLLMEIKDAMPKTGDMELVMFDDQRDSYPDENAAWNYHCGTEELTKTTRFQRSIEVAKLPASGRFHQFIVQGIRPRWWYVAAVDCSGVERTIEYAVHMENTNWGWLKEFSMDHCGPVPMIFALCVFVALAFAQHHAITRQTESARHPLRLMLLAAIGAACLGLGAQVVNAMNFARHGDDVRSLYGTGKFFKVLSKGFLASILVLLSKGVCISEPLRGKHLIQVTRLLAPFFSACLLLEIWGEYDQSRTYTTGFIYCTRFGAAIVIADLCFLAFYLKNVHDSCLAETQADKRRFYQFWGLLYSCAFMVLPLATFVSSVLAPWIREEVVFLGTNGVHAALLTSLVVGLWPEKTETFFNLQYDCTELATTIGIGMADDDTYQDLAEKSPRLLGSVSPKMVASTFSGTDDPPVGFPKGDGLP